MIPDANVTGPAILRFLSQQTLRLVVLVCFMTVASASTLRRDTIGNKQLASDLAWLLCHFVVLVPWYDDRVR